MSNDLISRKALIESIWYLFNNTYNNAKVFEPEETKLASRILSDVQKTIEIQAVAYDVELVVQQLEENSIDELGIDRTRFDIDKSECSSYCSLCLSDVIEIVKSGGVDNE